MLTSSQLTCVFFQNPFIHSIVTCAEMHTPPCSCTPRSRDAIFTRNLKHGDPATFANNDSKERLQKDARMDDRLCGIHVQAM